MSSSQVLSDASRVTPERDLRATTKQFDTPCNENRIGGRLDHSINSVSGAGQSKEIPAYYEKAKAVEDRIRKDVLDSKMKDIVTLVDVMVPDVFLPISPDQFNTLLQDDKLRQNNEWTVWPAANEKISEPDMEDFVNTIGKTAQENFQIMKRREYSSSTFQKPIHDEKTKTYYKPDGVFLRSFVFLQTKKTQDNKGSEEDGGAEDGEDEGNEDEEDGEDEEDKEDEKDEDYKENVKDEKSEKSDRILWRGTMGPVEMKPIDCAEAITQGSRYVQSVFNEQPGRQFVPLILVNGRKITLLIFDRSGAVCSEEMDVHVDYRKVLRLFLGILFLDEEHLGFDRNIQCDRSGLYIDTKDVKYKVKCIYHERGIRGRATVCYRGVSQVDGSEVVIKDTWVDITRTETEADVLEKLNANKEKDLSTPDGVRVIPKLVSREIVQRRRPGDEPGTWILVDASTALFRQGFLVEGDDGKAKFAWSSANKGGTGRKKVEIRTLHRVVMKPFGQKLETFTSKKTLMRAFSDVVHAMQILHGFGYVHRDISFKNIILHNHKGTLRGLLIDYDYTVSIKRAKSEAVAERTGTIPFMALDRLRPDPQFSHSFFHDLESVFYVICWVFTLYAGPYSRKRQFSDDFPYSKTSVAIWNGDDNGDRKFHKLLVCKRGTACDAGGFSGTLKQFAEYFVDLKKCMWDLQKLIFKPILLDDEREGTEADVAKVDEHYKAELSEREPKITEKMIEDYGGYPLGLRPDVVVFASFQAVLDKVICSLVEEETAFNVNEGSSGGTVIDVAPFKARDCEFIEAAEADYTHGRSNRVRSSTRLQQEIFSKSKGDTVSSSSRTSQKRKSGEGSASSSSKQNKSESLQTPGNSTSVLIPEVEESVPLTKRQRVKGKAKQVKGPVYAEEPDVFDERPTLGRSSSIVKGNVEDIDVQ